MNISGLYKKNVSKVFKKNYDKELHEYEDQFLPVFMDCCRFLPEDIAGEVFSKFVTYSDRDFKDALYNLINFFELFEENYDIDNDPFTQEEWDYIKMIVNDSTEEIGLDLVKYIMQVMLDLDLL